jgi:hypothetical protein
MADPTYYPLILSSVNGECIIAETSSINFSDGGVLSGLSDVHIAATPGEGQLLTWDNSDQRWEASAAPTGGGGDPAVLRAPTTNAESTITPDSDTVVGLTIAPPTDHEVNAVIVNAKGSTTEGVAPFRIFNDIVYMTDVVTTPTAGGSASRVAVRQAAGATKNAFAASDSGNNTIFKVDASGNLFASGSVSGATVSATNIIGISGTFTAPVSGVSGTTDNTLTTKEYVDSRTAEVSGDYILKDGSVAFTGNQSMGSNKLTSVTNPTADQDAATKVYVDENTVDVSGNYILKAGTVAFTGNQSMGSNKLTSVTNPTADQDAATKVYVDENTVDVSANYILKDGSVDFTGAQAGIAFGATEGVSGATVSGTNIVGISGTFTAAVSGVSGTTDNTLTTKEYVDSRTAEVSGDYILKDGSVAFTGNQSMGSNKLTSVTNPTADQDAATKVYVDENTVDVSGNYILKAGTVAFTGNQSMGSNKLTSVTNPTADQDAATKVYVDENTVDVSGDYILKDGSVDFTGAQSMGSNKLTSVADPTADRDAANKGYVDENTVDVSGDYTLKSGEVSFTGAVGGVSGTADASLTTNLMAFQRPFHHDAYRSGSFSNGQQIRLFLNTTDNDANFVIPAANTLKILAVYGRCKSGGTAGTTTWTLGIQTWENQAHAGARDWDLATGTTTSVNSYINVEARGTLASPLAAIVGADDPVGMVFIEHANSGGGSSGNDKHTIMVYGVFVDS